MAYQSSILNRPLSVYSIPPQLLDSLSVRSIQSQEEESGETDNNAEVQSSSQLPAVASSSGLGCQTCPGASFDLPEDQRAHFKTDWHRYNAKAKLNNSKIVTADEFDNVVDGVSSISGSASASSASSQDRITRLLKKTKVVDKEDAIDSDEEAELADLRRRAHLRTAVIWFQAKNTPPALGVEPDTQIGVYRGLFPSYETAGDYLNELKRLQLGPPVPEDEERRVALFMVAGGHFAGMIISLRPRGKSERQDVKGAGDVRVLQHKTFHRYTTRRKQGGSQGLNDNAKSKAVSAGAMLRRYGEQALQEEIRELLSEWEEDLEMCERIFIRASTHGKKSFWGYDGAVLGKADPRIRSFPFPTRRPTQDEVLRCWHELTRVKVSHLTAEALAAQDEEYMASLQPKKQAVAKPSLAPAPAPAPVPKLSPEEEARLDRAKRLDDMVRKGRVDALRTFATRYPSEITPATLGVAASVGQEDVLRFLLLDLKLDPTTPSRGWENVRNLFRRIAFDHPSLWDWQAAHVPSGLSVEAEAEQGARKAERRRGLREKMKEREKARAEVEAEEPAPPPPQPFASLGLGGRPDASSGLAGLSPEMRAQIERERRARAAEARFKQA
ncbi:hypothetical protein CcaverHIS002_0506980 [Cutaneotrichosporon cavernicola]|nr:hypothetical protein CcaverHIS002_0506980 [Cutaneotrichosporon cavernicola]